jgi:NAD+ kinase
MDLTHRGYIICLQQWCIMIKRAAIFGNPKVKGLAEIEASVSAILEKEAVRMVSFSENPELVITLGGDGTVLRAFGLLPTLAPSLLGLNFGKFGFLTSDCMELERVLVDACREELQVSPRIYLETSIERNGFRNRIGRALNEVVVLRKDIRILEFVIRIGKEHEGFRVKADGCIIGTPTGSTAHALSAGGPLIFPETECVVVAAIAPFMLTWRHCIHPACGEISVTASNECAVVLDGQTTFPLQEGETVHICRGQGTFSLLVPRGWDFWHTVREKFR